MFVILIINGVSMKNLFASAAIPAAIAAISLSSAIAGDIPANIKAGVDNPNRSEENRARDGDRKPGKVLSFFGVEEGMRVIDVASGGGYYTEIIAGAVGPDGSVSAQNRASDQFEEGRAALEAKFAPFGNITIDTSTPGSPLPYEDDSVDMIFLSLIIHHLHYAEESGETMPERSAGIYADIRRILKPGGTFAIIEHKAPDGTTREQSAAWHRISEDVMIADVTSAGFTLDATNDEIHNNPADDEQNTWFDESLRGKTTRLVHRYKSPD